MSLWTCPIHGLYGGDVFCPVCRHVGDYTTLASVDTRPKDEDALAASLASGAVPKADAQTSAKVVNND